MRKSGFDQIQEIIPKECLFEKFGGYAQEPAVKFPPSICCKKHEEFHDHSVYYSMRSIRSNNDIHDFLSPFENDDSKSTHKTTFEFEFQKKNSEMAKINESIISEKSNENTFAFNQKGKEGCCKCSIF